MTETAETLPPELQLALAYTPAELRPVLGSAFALDQRLGRIVAATTEPMLGQMRLAWWRNELEKDTAQRPQGDRVLDAVGRHWTGREAALLRMVDGWETLLTASDLDSAAIRSFGDGRGAFFAELAEATSPELQTSIRQSAFRWAIADAAAGVSQAAERERLVAEGLATGANTLRLPVALRGLAVLDALARRALERGGRPLIEGRGASLAAVKAAILRR